MIETTIRERLAVYFRVAASNFFFVILQNIREIFNYVFREISLEFREISQNKKSKFGRNFHNFANTKSKLGQYFGYFSKRDDF